MGMRYARRVVRFYSSRLHGCISNMCCTVRLLKPICLTFKDECLVFSHSHCILPFPSALLYELLYYCRHNIR